MSQWGAYAYDQKNDVARFTVTPQALANPVESLTLGFSDLKTDSATLYISWEKTRVPVKLEVDLVAQLVPQIEAAMAAPGEKKPYFQSAMFYYENNLDLKKAIEWMNAAVAANPGQMWMIYRKGLILAKAGDKAGALAAANESLELAKKETTPSLRDEYVRLNEALIASLK
jgi:tetratricopeptide (TPR) repeat protein